MHINHTQLYPLELDSIISTVSVGGGIFSVPSRPGSLESVLSYCGLMMWTRLESIHPATCMLDPCLPWLITSSRSRLIELAQEVLNVSLYQGVVPAALKDLVAPPLLKRTSLDLLVCENYLPYHKQPLLEKSACMCGS